MMMCNDLAIRKLSHQQKMSVLKKLAVKHQQKVKYLEDFGGIGDNVTAFLFRKILKSIGDKSFQEVKNNQKEYDFFDETMLVLDLAIINQIIQNFVTTQVVI